MSENLDCSICGNKIGIDANGWSQGNNAEPINDGRCCHLCDCMIVIPVRLMDIELKAQYQRDPDSGVAVFLKDTYKHYAGVGIMMLLQRAEINEKTP